MSGSWENNDMEKSHFALDNFSKISATFPPLSSAQINKQIHDIVMRQTNDTDFTFAMKKNYIAILLAGAMCVESNKERNLLEDTVIIEQSLPMPIMHFIKSPCNAIVCQYDTFEAVREEMWQNEPEFILEIVREQYERVCPGWIKGKDAGELIYGAKHFWEPLLTNLLSKYSGCEAKWSNTHNESETMALNHSLTALLRFGKSGHFGVSFQVLISTVGVIIPPFPICINDSNPISEIQCHIASGNGYSSHIPSILEEFNILETYGRNKYDNH